MCLLARRRYDIKSDERVEASGCACEDSTPAVRQEAVVFRPIARVDVEQSRGHNEDPRCQVNGVEDIVEDD